MKDTKHNKQLNMFGSGGIRGIVNIEIDPILATKVGMVVGADHKSAVIGRDPRTSSNMLNQAIIAGIVSAGCDITDIGIVSTPTLAIAAKDYDCGIMITASHNPAQYGGIKLCNSDGSAFNTAQQNNIGRLISEDDYTLAPWHNIGTIHHRDDAIERHIKKILESVPKSDMTVIVDCGNGAGSTITPYVLRRMGCKVITLNAQLDGHFPARTPEPTKESLVSLSKAVVSMGADLGIAHDGDADRMMAVDNTGRFITGDELLALFAIDSGAESIVVPVDTSMMVNKLFGKEVHTTRVGDAHISEKLKEVGAGFGGESSGSLIFPELSLCPDGIYAAAKMVHIISKTPIPQSSMVVKRGKILYKSSTGDKCKTPSQIMAEIEIAAKQLKCDDIITIDGIRVNFMTGWFLIRLSGTEPAVRITAESSDDETTQSIYKMAELIVTEAIE